MASISQRPRTAPDRAPASLFTGGNPPDPNLQKGRESESEAVFKPKDEEAIAVKWARDDVEAEKKLGKPRCTRNDSLMPPSSITARPGFCTRTTIRVFP